MPIFAWVLIGVLVPLGFGLALERWRRPPNWERTFALCATAATPVYLLCLGGAIAWAARGTTCLAGRCVTQSTNLVNLALPLAALDFCLLVGGAALGRSLRERSAARLAPPEDPFGDSG
jgi:predicted permease